MAFKSIKTTPTQEPKLVDSDPNIIKIMSEHYNCDYGSLYVTNCGINNNQTIHRGYCLIKNNKPIYNIPWRKDIDLIQKLYAYESKYYTVCSYDEYIEKIQKLYESDIVDILLKLQKQLKLKLIDYESGRISFASDNIINLINLEEYCNEYSNFLTVEYDYNENYPIEMIVKITY